MIVEIRPAWVGSLAGYAAELKVGAGIHSDWRTTLRRHRPSRGRHAEFPLHEIPPPEIQEAKDHRP